MPDPISAFVFLSQTVGLNTVAAAFIASNLATIALIGGSIAVGNYQRRKAMRRARDAYNASLQDRLVMTATTDGARSRIYGRARNVDGVLFKATRGNNSEFYTLIVALAGHEVDAIEDVYFGDELVTLDGNGYVQTAPWMQTVRRNDWASISISGGSGSVTLPFTPVAGSVLVTAPGQPADNALGYTTDVIASTVIGTQVNVTGAAFSGTASVSYQYDVPNKSYARVRKYLGSPSQDLSADLVADFPALCTANDKFRGIALLRVDLEYSQDAFSTGVPQISAVVRGARVYDPRNSTTAWSQNPALIARDWAMYPYGGSLSAVDDAAFAVAANACDVDATFAAPSGSVVMDTYQAGIVCKLDADPSASLSEMVEAMAGRWGFSGGVLTVVAGATRGTVATLTEDWITDASQIVITPAPPRSELVNAYRPTISNRLNKYQAEPTPPVIASTYVTDDGQQLDSEITMAAVTHPLHAQHVAGVLLRDARQSLTVTLPCNLRAFKLQLFDVVAVTLSRFGWSAKLFEVMGWRFTLGGLVQLTLKEHSAAVYTPDAGFADLGYSDNTELPDPWTVEAVQGLAVTSGTAALTDGSVVTRTQVSWTAATDANVLQAGRIEIQWAEAYGTTVTEFPSTTEAGNTTSTVISGLRGEIVYVFRARYINAAGVRGRWSLHVAHRIAAATTRMADFENMVANHSGQLGTAGWSAMRSGKSTGVFGGDSEYWLFGTGRDNYYGEFFRVSPGDEFYFEFTSVPSGGGAGDYTTSLGLFLRGADPSSGAGQDWIGGCTRAPSPGGVRTVSGSLAIPNGYSWAQVWIQIDTFGTSAGYFYKSVRAKRKQSTAMLGTGAATQILTHAASAAAVTGFVGGASHTMVVNTISFSASEAFFVILSATGSYTYTTGSGSGNALANVDFWVSENGGPFARVSGSLMSALDANIGASTTRTGPVNLSATFVCNAGSSYVFDFCVRKSAAAGTTMTMDFSNMRLEVIKR